MHFQAKMCLALSNDSLKANLIRPGFRKEELYFVYNPHEFSLYIFISGFKQRVSPRKIIIKPWLLKYS